MVTQAVKSRMREILKILCREYPEAECRLNFETPFQLLVATMLSAQCTDDRVNLVTPKLFKVFPDARSMAEGDAQKIESLISSVNFYRNKAKALSETSRLLVSQHDGQVPQTMEELILLRGTI